MCTQSLSHEALAVRRKLELIQVPSSANLLSAELGTPQAPPAGPAPLLSFTYAYGSYLRLPLHNTPQGPHHPILYIRVVFEVDRAWVYFICQWRPSDGK